MADELIPKLLRPEADAATVKVVRDLIRQGTPACVAAAQRGMARHPDSTATLASVACPLLVVVGAEDSMTPPAEAQKLAKAVKGDEAPEAPGCGARLEPRESERVQQGAQEFV